MNGWIKYFFSRNGWTIRMLHNDPRVSVILSPEDAPSILIMSVDDCYLQGEREEDLEYIRRSFGDAFGIKRADPKHFMGYSMEIETLTNMSRTLTITQPGFVEDLLLEFGNHIPVETMNVPFGPSTIWNEPDTDPDIAEQR